jgi:hypothetical protein
MAGTRVPWRLFSVHVPDAAVRMRLGANMSGERFPQFRATTCRRVCTLLTGCEQFLGATRGIYAWRANSLKR